MLAEDTSNVPITTIYHLSSQIMDLDKLLTILMGVVGGCCVLLFVVVTYLCVAVSRIRRKLDDLSRRGSFTLEKNGGDKETKRISSGVRYTGEPLHKQRQQSAVYSEPGEPVEFLERSDGREIAVVVNRQALASAPSTQNIVEKNREPEHVPLQFVNQGFSPEAAEDSKRGSSSDSNESQPIYSNEEAEQGIYENNNGVIDEPIYQNSGELAYINNPDLNRCHTMDISQIP